jgi:hypothetical protein
VTVAGWLLLGASCSAITTWVTWCYVRVLAAPRPSEELHAPLEIDTRDV